jgi:predicted rRNA methylase YqxC with S4 and FtsJ domains
VKYFKAKKIVSELTTSSIHPLDQEKLICYDFDGTFEYYGVDLPDLTAFIAAQSPELLTQEVAYIDIKSILDNCQKMKDFNAIIERQIADQYTLGRELKMRDLVLTDPDRITYENYKTSIKTAVNTKKVEFGLILAS